MRAYEGDPNLTAEDVKTLTQAVAREIYRTAYWNRMQCGALPAGLDLEVFDFGVNSGPAESVKTLQRLVGVTQDGSVGPITLAAVRQFNVGDLIGRFAQARLAFYQSLNMPEFEQGWATRVAQIQTAATKMLDASQVAVALSAKRLHTPSASRSPIAALPGASPRTRAPTRQRSPSRSSRTR